MINSKNAFTLRTFLFDNASATRYLRFHARTATARPAPSTRMNHARRAKTPAPDDLHRFMDEVVRRHAFLAGVRRLGIAVSGGADSVALLCLLLPPCRRAGVVPVVLHLDHGLRGADSTADGAFVRDFAAARGLACRAAAAHVAPARGRSLEMAAREARLDFFFESARAEALDAVATGHQADDVAETLLLRLVRGAGAGGLAGLRPCSVLTRHGRTLRLIRPLLDLPRAALDAWLRAQGIPWREDASNRDTRIARNAVRHALLPCLERLAGRPVAPALARSAEILRADDEALDALAGAWLARQAAKCVPGDPAAALSLPLPDLASQPVALQRRILRLWLMRQGQAAAAGFTSVERLREALARPADWRLTLPGSLHLGVRQGCLGFLERHAAPVPGPAPLHLPVPGQAEWPGLAITARLAHGILREPARLGQWPAACSLDREAADGQPLTLRARLPGDRIAPTGMTGSRRIQDIFVDAKLPREARDRLPLLFCGGTLAWVPGYRVARALAVRGESAPAIHIRITRTPV